VKIDIFIPAQKKKLQRNQILQKPTWLGLTVFLISSNDFCLGIFLQPKKYWRVHIPKCTVKLGLLICFLTGATAQ